MLIPNLYIFAVIKIIKTTGNDNKANQYAGRYANSYFWRTTQQQEIDYVEESDGRFSVSEMKWTPRRANTQFPSSFLTAYDVEEKTVVTPENWMEWVM